MNIADRIRGKMAEQRVSVKSMTKLFGITPQTWASWMRNPERISVGRLMVIATKLNTTAGELIGG